MNRKGRSRLEKYLLRYQDALAEETLIARRIDSLDSYAKRTVHRITGMPAVQGDGSVLPALIDEREQLRLSAEKTIKLKSEIIKLIKTLPRDERRLLTAYYIEGMSLENAAEFVPCSPRTAVKMKKNALQRLQTTIELRQERRR